MTAKGVLTAAQRRQLSALQKQADRLERKVDELLGSAAIFGMTAHQLVKEEGK